MRATRQHIVTYRDDPADAEVISHRLMVRAGYVQKVGAGLFVYGPLMWRVLSKIKAVINQELAAVGSLEIQMPILQPQELWEKSGRWDVYRASGLMFTVNDRRNATYGLAPTAEEVVTAYANATVTSYKQLPLCVHQINTKFRDELRPRFGLLRVKEFEMKDAYSFDADEDALDVSFDAMKGAYERIFKRLGLETFGVEADAGDIGGAGSIEFMVSADAGEDAILLEPGSTYAANVETAISHIPAPSHAGEEPNPMRIVDTPDIRSMVALCDFFPDIPKTQMVKTILCKAIHADREVLWAVLIRGDQDVNLVKLRNHTGGLAIEMLTEGEITQHTGAEQGFAGPVGLAKCFSVVADETVRGLTNILCGANQTDKHALDVNLGRDCPTPDFADVRTARAGEPGPHTGAPLVERRGIEVGHIFKLGTKYSAPMGATFMNVNGKALPFHMGCYGIGVSRVAASAIEQKATEAGMVWPVPMAPFECAVVCLDMKKAPIREGAESIYAAVQEAGIEVLFDDRKASPGVKLKDSELLGFPFVIIVGRSFAKTGDIEVRDRLTGEKWEGDPATVVAEVAKRIEAARSGLL